MTLYELTDEYLQLLQWAEEEDLDEQALADTLDGLGAEIEDKADGYVIVMKELEAQADKFEKEEKRLSERKATLRNNIKRMKDSLLNTMQVMDKKKLETEHFKLSIAKNGGLAPLKITGEVPAAFCKLEPDNNLIRKALEAGEGDIEWAHLEERGVHLSVR